jgi:dihydroorotase-like cyclic amidohydrolase
MEEIVRSLNDGTLDNISTDHAPHTLEELEMANTDAWQSNLGSPQLEWLYSLILTDVAAGQLPLARAVKLLAENPAKLVGVWPRKGVIMPGADADLALVDLDAEFTVTDEKVFTKCAWSPWVGRTLQGTVIGTLLRGKTIFWRGEITAQPGYGRYLPGTPQPR